MSHRDTDQPRVDRDLLDQLVRENGLTPDYINDAERQDREAAREWLNENVFDWDLPEHEIQLASEGSGGGGYWDGSTPVRLHTFDGVDNGYRSGHYLHYTIASIAQALQACYGLEASVDFQTSITSCWGRRWRATRRSGRCGRRRSSGGWTRARHWAAGRRLEGAGQRAGEVIRRHATGVIVGRALQQSWHREREADAGKGDTGERARRRVASIGEWDRRMIYR